MIKNIRIENFKAFGGPTSIECAPITLIFGQNSAGKSSILHSLNLLKQTRESREVGAALLPRPEEKITDLGSFQELLFDHDLNRTLRLGIEVEVDRGQPYPSPWEHPLGAIPKATLRSLGLDISFQRPSSADEVQVTRFTVWSSAFAKDLTAFEALDPPRELGDRALRFWAAPRIRSRRRRPSARAGRCVMVTDEESIWLPVYREWHSRRTAVASLLESQLKRTNREQLELPLGDPDDPDRKSRPEALRQALSFYSHEFSLSDYRQRMSRAALKTIVPLDGFIPLPGEIHPPDSLPELEPLFDRMYRVKLPDKPTPLPLLNFGLVAAHAGRLIEDAFQALFPMGPFRRPPERWYIFTGTSPVDVGYKGDLLPDLLFRRPELVKKANAWLKRLDIGYQLRVRSLGKNATDLFEVRLVDSNRKGEVDVALSDVGFGVSQILPFIVQCLSAERQIISIEQPEVHIHPKLQADLGDLVAEASQEPYNHQFLLETHSEHLVLRIQKLIRERKLRPEDVSVIYVERSEQGSRARRLRLDDDGDFVDEWPGGFFPERSRELF